MKNNSKKLLTYGYGFPRLGIKREYKKLVEGFWDRKIKEKELRDGIYELEEERLKTYQKYVDKFPVGEMTFYDNVLDTAIMLGLYETKNLDQYFGLCRGKDALELTKWFNTNYHYLVPRFSPVFKSQDFRVAWNKPKEELLLHKKGIPYLIGPFTFLKLSKGISQKDFGLNPEVKERIKNLKEDDFKKSTSYRERFKIQKKILSLPLFPTTTIGSFPQTTDVRKRRADFNSGKISKEDYKSFIKRKIRELIKFQEDLGLDVFVHGEFERTDMVEFFAQRLEQYA